MIPSAVHSVSGQRKLPEEGLLAWRYPIADMEIRNGAQLTVRESQMAAFVNEGRIADVFGPGLYTLNTRNLPAADRSQQLGQGFRVPLQIRRLFLSTRIQTDQRWGNRYAHHHPRKESGRAPARYGNLL